jgi:Secretion system C-terminal sorting domain
MKTSLVAILFLVSISCFAQEPDVQWVRHLEDDLFPGMTFGEPCIHDRQGFVVKGQEIGDTTDTFFAYHFDDNAGYLNHIQLLANEDSLRGIGDLTHTLDGAYVAVAHYEDSHGLVKIDGQGNRIWFTPYEYWSTYDIADLNARHDGGLFFMAVDRYEEDSYIQSISSEGEMNDVTLGLGSLFVLGSIVMVDDGYLICGTNHNPYYGSNYMRLYKYDWLYDRVWSYRSTDNGTALGFANQLSSGFIFGFNYYNTMYKFNSNGRPRGSYQVNNLNQSTLAFHESADNGIIFGGHQGSWTEGHALLTKMDFTQNVIWRIEQPSRGPNEFMRTHDGGYLCTLRDSDHSNYRLVKIAPEANPVVTIDADTWDENIHTIAYSVEIDHSLSEVTALDLWATVTGPYGIEHVAGLIPAVLVPGDAFSATSEIHIDGSDFPGEYKLEISIGDSDNDLVMGRGTLFIQHQQMTIPSDDQDAISSNGLQVSVTPNPFNTRTTISVTLPEATKLSVKVYNPLGRVVATLVEGQSAGAGVNRYTLDGSTLASGIYFVHAVVPGELNDVRKIVLMK